MRALDRLPCRPPGWAGPYLEATPDHGRPPDSFAVQYWFAPIALARRDDATLLLVPAFGVLVVSVLAWMLLGPVRVASADGSWAPALAETILAMIVIGGLEGLFITMLPLGFLDGATVMAWSRIAWVLVFGTVTFLWWQLLLNEDHAYVAALEQTNVQVVLGVLAVFMVTTGGLWSYFRFKPGSSEVAA